VSEIKKPSPDSPAEALAKAFKIEEKKPKPTK